MPKHRAMRDVPRRFCGFNIYIIAFSMGLGKNGGEIKQNITERPRVTTTEDTQAPLDQPSRKEHVVLQLHDIDVVYQEVIRALHGVSIEVRSGTVVALLGPNGAGKTTVLRAIGGLLSFHRGRIANGSVQFRGKDVTRSSPASIVHMGLGQALEGRRIFSGLSVIDNIRVGAQGKATAAAVEEVMALFPVLAERRHQAGGLLSGGEQQMLAMARALIGQPSLLLLDEPSLGLAPLIVDQVAELIVRINRERGTTVLVVEQNAAVALDIADHVYIMENGRIAVSAPTSEIRGNDDIVDHYLGTPRNDRTLDSQHRRLRPGRRII
jgi:branched-chain amino acid transport system ATP-binding protein